MAISTYKVFLMKKGTGDAYEKVCDITSFPDLGSDPDLLETTTLSDKMRTYILGLQNNDGLTFATNYDKTTYTALAALEGVDAEYSVWFGGTEGTGGTVTPTGSDGKFSFGGQMSSHVTGGGVNEVVGISMTIAPSTVITFA